MGSLQPPIFSSSTPLFFQIFRDEKLKIPKKFVMKYGGELSDTVCLKIPSGSEWEVELARCNGEIWFEKGWPEFSLFCSLDYGDFVVFRYEGNSKFHVCILDKSTTEIDYPITMPKIEETDEDDDLSTEILEDISLSSCPPSKKMRTSLRSKAVMISNQPIRKRTSDVTGMAHSLTTHDALQRANAFRSDCPSFTLAMLPSYVSQQKLCLPSGFGKRYLLGSTGNVILRVSDGKTWSMNLYNYKNSNFGLQSGWLKFVKDNILEVGDACVFMLKNKVQLLFDVIFFRNKESAKDSLSPAVGKSKTSRNCGKVTQRSSSSLRDNVQAADKFTSENPFVKITMAPLYLGRSTLFVPAKLAKNLIEQGEKIVLLQVKDGSWPVNLIKYKSSRMTYLCDGWTVFAKANCLSEGDICIFELIDTIDCKLEVHIFRC